MKHRRPRKSANQRRQSSPARLLLERLESRRLLAGISVNVFVELESAPGGGTIDSPAPNRLVYIDLDRSDTYERGEPIATTDSSGTAFFRDLAEGSYAVGLITNSETQIQTEPTRSGTFHQLAASSVENILTDPEFKHIWSVDSDGLALPLRGFDSAVSPSDLGGKIVNSFPLSNELLGVVIESPGLGRQLIEFNVSTGATRTPALAEIPAGSHIDEVFQSGDAIVAVLQDGAEHYLAVLSGPSSGAISPLGMSIVSLAGNASSSYVAAIAEVEGGHSTIGLMDRTANFQPIAALSIDGQADWIEMSATGDRILVGLAEGGVVVLDVEGSAIKLAAILDEAAGPVATSSRSHGVATGNRVNPHELIVWDRPFSGPISRLPLPNQAILDESTQIWLDTHGSELLLLQAGALSAVDLDLAILNHVVLSAPEQIAMVRFGVRTSNTNTPPDVSEFAERSLKEDTSDQFELHAAPGISDAENDVLWATISVEPQHGSLSVSTDGTWTYRPSPDYNGSDWAKLWLLDGQDASELVIQWQVTPVNDPPVSMTVSVAPMAEDIPAGLPIGTISIIDIDLGAAYRITTSDPRFSADQGRVFFVDGTLDFETEATIWVEFVATDVSNANISIARTISLSILDRDETPTQLFLSNNQVPENQFGAIVGEVTIDDPDFDSHYHFFVSDPRFTVEDGILKLVDSAMLNYQTEREISLSIDAQDENGEGLIQPFKISVTQNNQLPSSLALSRQEVLGFVAGAVVGELTVVNPRHALYRFTASDPRFIVVGNQLQLNPNQMIDPRAESQVSLTVTATAANGNDVQESFSLAVIRLPSPYHNQSMPGDVNGDGMVSPVDVLIIINELNENGSYPLPHGGDGTGEPPAAMLDVNGDGIVSPLDALLIINELNELFTPENSPLSGEGEASNPASPALYSDIEREADRRQQTMRADAELESLLNQLSQARHH
jgi:VCBS repeat-containing protein